MKSILSRMNSLNILNSKFNDKEKPLIQSKNEYKKERKRANVWYVVSLLSIFLNSVMAVGYVVLALTLPSKLSEIKYILSPGIQSLTVVRPGELSSSYVETSFKHVASMINGWNYDSIEDNFKILYDQWYSTDLKNFFKNKLKTENYISKVKDQKMHSLWRYIPAKSEMKWCPHVKIGVETKGVACGIVTGQQRLFIDGSEVSNREISYLMFAVNVAPNATNTGKNMFAIQLFRVKRGNLYTLKNELQNALNTGVLPKNEGENNEFY